MCHINCNLFSFVFGVCHGECILYYFAGCWRTHDSRLLLCVCMCCIKFGMFSHTLSSLCARPPHCVWLVDTNIRRFETENFAFFVWPFSLRLHSKWFWFGPILSNGIIFRSEYEILKLYMQKWIETKRIMYDLCVFWLCVFRSMVNSVTPCPGNCCGVVLVAYILWNEMEITLAVCDRDLCRVMSVDCDYRLTRRVVDALIIIFSFSVALVCVHRWNWPSVVAWHITNRITIFIIELNNWSVWPCNEWNTHKKAEQRILRGDVRGRRPFSTQILFPSFSSYRMIDESEFLWTGGKTKKKKNRTKINSHRPVTTGSTNNDRAKGKIWNQIKYVLASVTASMSTPSVTCRRTHKSDFIVICCAVCRMVWAHILHGPMHIL